MTNAKRFAGVAVFSASAGLLWMTFLSSSALSKMQEEPLPEVVDMYDLKPQRDLSSIPASLPVVASSGTPTMSREEAIALVISPVNPMWFWAAWLVVHIRILDIWTTSTSEIL